MSDQVERSLQEQMSHRRTRPEGRLIGRTGLGEASSSESWIEVSSQRASSSLYSNNEIITTGLHVERSSRQLRSSNLPQPRTTSVAGSSQDEYEESESESDQVMSSSNEDIQEDDDTATALGTGTNVFTPQPNAFTHPPTRSTPGPESYFPTIPVSNSDRLPSNRMVTQRTIQRRAPQNHDEALHASLTTLLSCAAAVRPKDAERIPLIRSNQPTTLRLVPESELDAPPKLVKRRSRESSKERHAKKLRAVKAVSGDETMSPTMMIWMISAGVVLVFSAISFSAGYAWGKEVGRLEEVDCSNCGREAIKAGGGLRKIRWSAAQSARV